MQGNRSSSRRDSPARAANAVFASSDTGVLAYRAGAAQRRQLVWVNRQGAVLRAIGEPDTDYTRRRRS